MNSIHPGFVLTRLAIGEGMDPTVIQNLIGEHATRLSALGRPGEADEIARLALFLASDESSYCSGSEFVADGGLIAGYPAPGTPF